MEIHIHQYPVYMKLGYYAMERLMGQEVLVSLDAQIGDIFLQDELDDLGQSIDYGKIIASIDEVLLHKEIKLVEKAVACLGGDLMRKFKPLLELRVLIEKPVLPDGISKGARVSVSHLFTRSLDDSE